MFLKKKHIDTFGDSYSWFWKDLLEAQKCVVASKTDLKEKKTQNLSCSEIRFKRFPKGAKNFARINQRTG